VAKSSAFLRALRAFAVKQIRFKPRRREAREEENATIILAISVILLAALASWRFN
jgi:hypothetical protein